MPQGEGLQENGRRVNAIEPRKVSNNIAEAQRKNGGGQICHVSLSYGASNRFVLNDRSSRRPMPTLNWLTRDEDIKAAERAPYRLLVPVADLSYGDPNSGNMLIQGDNLEALKALLPYYAGRVKCIYIDPPYNTRSAFEQYDDSLEHAKWLSMIYPRLEFLWQLLSEEGCIFVSIDDHEAHYLKVLMDEVCSRANFVGNIVWQKRTSRENRAALGSAHDHIVVYAKGGGIRWKDVRNRLPPNTKGFANPDNDPRGPWRSIPFSAQGYRPNQMYDIRTLAGTIVHPPKGRCWAATEPIYKQYLAEQRVYFPNGGKGRPRIKQFSGEEAGLVPMTWWDAALAGDNEEAKKEILNLFPDQEPFATPKPEELIRNILHIGSSHRDLVLDSFLGSGTTAAVAHKMGRRYIGIEMGDHAVTHCVPRLKKVIDGERGGISEQVNWQGGGGFRFYRLGEVAFDAEGRVNPVIRFPTLAAHVWFSETGTPISTTPRDSMLGVHDRTAYYLLYNGVLGDLREQHGNVLNRATLAALPPFPGPKVIYAEQCRLSPAMLAAHHIAFRQTPYDIKAR